MRCFYFGVWEAGSAGHYLYRPGGSFVHDDDLPFSVLILDSHLIPHDRRDAKAQDGKLYRSVINGWTIVTCWDQSGDSRPASNSAFVVEGEHTIEAAIAVGRAAFPLQASREGFPLK